METPFDYDNFPQEITADPMTPAHNAEIFEMLQEAIKDDRYNHAEAHAGYLYDRKGYLEFQPLGTDQREYLQNEDMLIQFSIRIARHDAEELGLIDLERTIIAEDEEAETARLEAEAIRLQAAAAATKVAADEATQKAMKARAK